MNIGIIPHSRQEYFKEIWIGLVLRTNCPFAVFLADERTFIFVEQKF